MTHEQQTTSDVVQSANWGARMREWATTLKRPTTRKGWFWVGFTAFMVIAVVILPLYGVRLFGITPLAGKSMEPTFKAMPIPPRIAAYYRTSSSEPIELGCLVQFRTEGEDSVSVKRVVDISGDRVWVKADNFGVTGKDSDTDYGWIPASNCRKITWVWTPARALRSRSAEGRLQNWAELRASPSSIEWGPNGLWWATQRTDKIEVYHGRELWKVIQGEIKEKKDGILLISQPVEDGQRFEHLSYSFEKDELVAGLGNDWRKPTRTQYTIRFPQNDEIDLRQANIDDGIEAAVDDDPETNWGIGPTDDRIVSGSIEFHLPQKVRSISIEFAGDASVQMRVKVDGKTYNPASVQSISKIEIELEKGRPSDCAQISEIRVQKG